MMDLSDGISKDAATLCYENRLGLELSSKTSPSREMAELGRELGIPWQEWALHGGEEYELLVAKEREKGEGRREKGEDKRQESVISSRGAVAAPEKAEYSSGAVSAPGKGMVQIGIYGREGGSICARRG